MTDERIFDLLASHDGPTTPDAGYEDRLFSLLQGELARRRRSPQIGLMFAAALAAVALLGAAAIGAGLLTLPFVDREPMPVPSPSAALTPTPGPSATHAPESGGRMLGMHVGHTASLLADGRVLVAGGWDDFGAEVYDPALATWTVTGPMVESRVGHTATVLPDGRLLVVGGTTDGPAYTSAEVYDPVTNTWAATASITTARARHTATLLPDGRVLVAGGSSEIHGGTRRASVEIYDPATGEWTAAADMNEARAGHTATLLESGLVLLAGGAASSRAELYDPALGTWTLTGTMAASRNGHAAILLADSRVLVVGGALGLGTGVETYSEYAEVYDPATAAWARAGTWIGLGTPAVALLPDDRVLVSGEAGSVELYEPSDRVWTAAPALSPTFTPVSATLLSDGTVLFVGGWDGRDRSPSPFERYRAPAE